MSELAKQLIKKEKRERTGKLELGKCGLTDLEKEVPELFECDWLEELTLSNRWWDWKKVKWIESENKGDDNRLAIIPPTLPLLLHLKILRIGGDYLGTWQISDASFLGKLIELQYLDLSYNQISDASFLGNLTGLQSLYLSSNQISDASFLGNLTGLQSLDLSGNQISDYSFLGNLTGLQSLDLRSNQISDYSFLGNLTGLQSLDLSYNQISDASFLGNLTGMQSLDLSGNQISDASFLGNLTGLQSLYLSGNQISDASFLGNLTGMQSLDLSYNQISDASFLGNLTGLQSLYLSYNQISDYSFLGNLTGLQSLDLSYNQISDASFLGNLTGLQSLYLSSNQISDASFLGNLTGLQSLDLNGNQIKSTIFLKSLPKVQSITLYNNPLKDIPKGLVADYNCIEHLKAWWSETADPTHTQPNRTIKMMLTGNGNAGKSTLFHALKAGKCEMEMDSTHGVLLETWVCSEVPSVEFIIWDFGGQEIYHGSHRLFMASDAIQLVLFDPVTEKAARENLPTYDRITGEETQEQPLLYWIDTARQLSRGSIIMAVQNKKDIFPERYQPAYEVAAKQNIDYHHVSARQGNGINTLLTAIHENAQNLLDYGMPMPRSWVVVRQFFLENLQKEEKERVRLISKEEFFKRCKEEYGVMEIAIPSLLTLLHSNGILYYNEQFLKDTIIADQRWALDAIYKPLDRKSDFYDRLRKDTYGKARVKHIFKEFGAAYTEGDKWLFLHFMRSCGLCFPMKQANRDEKETEESLYIFPEFLPKVMSEGVKLIWEGKNRQTRYFRKTYEYLNYYRIQSFIAKLGQKTRMEYIWRNGIFIHTEEGDFKVFTENKALVIAIDETAIPKWLNEIIKELEGKPLDAIKEGWQTSENGIDYEACDLQAIRNKHVDNFGKPEVLEAVVEKKPLSERLPDVSSPRPLRLIASYASQDRDAVIAVHKQLQPLKEAGKLEFWYDQKLDGRNDWDNDINEQFEEADGYIVFVSSDYTDYETKKYIHEKEIPIMQRRHEQHNIPIYCLTVRPVDYGPKLAKFLFFKDKKPIPPELLQRDVFLDEFVRDMIKQRFLKL